MYRIAFVMEQALGHVAYAKNLYGNLASDHTVEVCWLPIPFEVEGWAAKLPIYRSNWTVRAGWRARRALRQTARRTDLDGLFIHTQVPGVLSVDWVRRYPSVVSLDATPLQYDALGAFYQHERGPDWLERQKFCLNRRLFQAADHLVTWTAWAKESLVQDYGLRGEKVTVIPPGVNPGDWACTRPRDRGEGKVRILFVGGDLARKGGDLLLTAFRELRRRGKQGGSMGGDELELHLVTRTPVDAEPGVFAYDDIVPNDPRLVQLYQQADIFALPTSGDCLPMVLSEAGAAGLPVVSTRVAGIPEIVADGQSGILIDPHDGQALTEALGRLIGDADLRLRMGCRAQEIIGERFDTRKNAARLLEIIKSTARGAAQRGSE